MRWEKVKLGNVIEKAISGEWGEEGDGVFVLRTTNFSNDGALDLREVVKRNIDSSKVEKKKLRFGDTIIEKSGGSPNQPVGRVVYFNIKPNDVDTYLCNNFTSILRPTNNINSKYLFWFLFNNHITKQTLRYQNKTTGIINLQTERYLNELQIPLPPLPIQQKIAAILDQADALRKKDQQLLAKYDELLQAVFYDMFGDPVRNEKGWENKKLEKICIKITDGTHQSPKFLNEGIPFLLVSNIIDNEIDYQTEKYISRKEYEELIKRTPIEIGDILLTTVGSYGNPAIVESKREFCFQRHIAYIKPNHNIINVEYLFGSLKSNYLKNQIDRKVRGVAQKTLNLGDLKSLEIPFPPITIQKKFGTITQTIQKQKQQAKLLMEQSETLFQSLLQRAFKGELVKE